ncbi:MAG: dihydroorotase, partial [Erysipelotrichaceae bacterium]|nr:dihydroorotase [Erysipelotrichaceae bacterium]
NDSVCVDVPGFASKGDHIIFPGFCDVHVHFREPGFSYKETIASGSLAAAHGGYTTVCPMPNLNPVPDSLDHLKKELQIIKQDALIDVIPYGSCTVNEEGKLIADLEEMSPYVCAFSDDGKGIQEEAMMKEVMLKAKSLGKIVAAHCEVNSLLNGGYIHDGIYAKEHGHKGICSQSEWQEIQRDVSLAKETGCSYHVCHISTKESVEIIRQAKKDGVDVTCETAPHYLILNENDLQESGNFKMNPPLRSKEDQEALIKGIQDGTIDMIATDHAPHSKEEKSGGLEKSAMGIVGLETAFPLLYTYLVKKGIITLERLIELLNDNPRKRFGLKQEDSWCLWDLSENYIIDEKDFLSKGKASPFKGMEVYGRCLKTVCKGKTVYEYKGE